MSADEAAERALEQARRRKERREAKIKAGGADRLNKITGLGGGVERDPPAMPSVSASAPDPAEVDISQHFYQPPGSSLGQIGSAPPDLQNLMFGAGGGVPPSGDNNQQEQLLLQQLLQQRQQQQQQQQQQQTQPGQAGAGAPPDPFAAMLSEMLAAGGAPGVPQQQQQSPFLQMPQAAGGPSASKGAGSSPSPSLPSIWQMLHTLVALGLGLIIAVNTSFNGTLLQREWIASGGGLVPTTSPPVDGGSNGGDDGLLDDDPLVTDPAHQALASLGAYGHGSWSSSVFSLSSPLWIFATSEAILFSLEYLLSSALSPASSASSAPGGPFSVLVQFLPRPYCQYLSTILRYGQFVTTIRRDLLLCVFVLGVCTYLRS